jgi:hypothetical protein
LRLGVSWGCTGEATGILASAPTMRLQDAGGSSLIEALELIRSLDEPCNNRVG